MRHIPGSGCQAVASLHTKMHVLRGLSSQTAHLTTTHSFQLPPSLASVQWWSAQCPWGVGCPAPRPWKWPRTPSCSSSVQVLPRPGPRSSPPSLRCPCGQSFFPQCGFGRRVGNLPGVALELPRLPPPPPPGPQPPHLTLCRRLGVHSCPGSGVSAGRAQLRRGALWHHGPAHRTAGAERPRAAH